MRPSQPPVQREATRVLLLENVHTTAHELLGREGFQIESISRSLPEAELRQRLRGVHILGIRSKTQLRDSLLTSPEADDLHAIGCFCIGTNQVDLTAANRRGVAVFNAPFSNTRSVAELILAEIIALARQLGDRSSEVHAGKWRKIAAGCHEVRGKTLGIVGYGHIGSQVGTLAESLGMRVVYHDIVSKLALGNCQPVETLAPLLAQADFVTLHVPATPQTHLLFQRAELRLMKPGACLLNASRGTVVDIDALAEALRDGHLSGAAIDVYPDEPESNSDGFLTPLQGLPNVILTPHIGGSTEEAQASIGREVAHSLAHFLKHGTSTGAVNFPNADLPPAPGTHRILNVHRNVPGVLKDINRIVGDLNANIHGQLLATDPNIGYLIMDLDQDVSQPVRDAMANLATSIRTRILY